MLSIEFMLWILHEFNPRQCAQSWVLIKVNQEYTTLTYSKDKEISFQICLPFEGAHVGLRIQTAFTGAALRDPEREHEITASARGNPLSDTLHDADTYKIIHLTIREIIIIEEKLQSSFVFNRLTHTDTNFYFTLDDGLWFRPKYRITSNITPIISISPTH